MEDTIQVVTSDTLRSFVEAAQPVVEEAPKTEAKVEEPPAEAKVEPVAADMPEQPEDDGQGGKKPLTPRQRELNERFSKLATQRKEAEAAVERERVRAEAAEKELAELRKGKTEPVKEEKVEANAKPDPTKFSDPFEYAEALTDWKIAERDRLATEAAAKKSQEEAMARAQAEAKSAQERFNQRRDSFKAETPDFDQVMEAGKGVQMRGECISAMIESDFGPQMMYDLLKDPEKKEIKRLNELPMRTALREIGKMEAKYEKAMKSEPDPVEEVTRVSKAPEPITPIKSGSGGAGSSKLDKDGNFTGSQEEYEKLRRERKIH